LLFCGYVVLQFIYNNGLFDLAATAELDYLC